MLKDTQPQKQYRILLIGETCLDIYNMGNVERLSPEAPVPILKKNKSKTKLGMAGNVKQNIESMLQNVEIDVLSNDPQKIQKIRFIDESSKYQILRYDIEEKLVPLSLKDVITLEDKEKYDAVVISDYNKGLIDEKFVKDLKSQIKCKIFVDSKKSDLSLYSGCLLKINEKESKNLKEDSRKDLDIIVTLGPKGCSYRGKRYKTKSVEVYDVCGAGDVFLSALVVRWLETNNIEKSILTANQCAAASVTRLGCYTVKNSEYKNLRR